MISEHSNSTYGIENLSRLSQVEHFLLPQTVGKDTEDIRYDQHGQIGQGRKHAVL